VKKKITNSRGPEEASDNNSLLGKKAGSSISWLFTKGQYCRVSQEERSRGGLTFGIIKGGFERGRKRRSLLKEGERLHPKRTLSTIKVQAKAFRARGLGDLFGRDKRSATIPKRKKKEREEF